MAVKVLLRLLLLSVCFGLTACDSVFVEQPLGDEVVVLDPALWQGQWTNGEMVITTTVIDADKGILQAAWLERGEQGAEMEMATGYVRRSGAATWLNLPNYDSDEAFEEDPEKDRTLKYHWALLQHDVHRAILWWPNQSRFRDAVQAGTLPGIVRQDDDVMLGALSAEQLQLISSPQANLLNWADPLVFVRIAD